MKSKAVPGVQRQIHPRRSRGTVRELNVGVHLGKLDMPVAEARRILGPEYLIGATANTFEDIGTGAGQGADYIGLGGPFRFTRPNAT